MFVTLTVVTVSVSKCLKKVLHIKQNCPVTKGNAVLSQLNAHTQTHTCP